MAVFFSAVNGCQLFVVRADVSSRARCRQLTVFTGAVRVVSVPPTRLQPEKRLATLDTAVNVSK